MILSAEYLAGFFDGEGNIGYNKGLEVKISQQNPIILVTIHALFKESKFQAGSECWEVRFYGKNAKRFLELILPFSYVKKSQIELALKLLNGEINKENISSLLKAEKNSRLYINEIYKSD